MCHHSSLAFQAEVTRDPFSQRMPRRDVGRMMADNVQYTTVCPRCRGQLPLSRKQVETGRPPICDGCGGTMIVHGSCLGLHSPPEMAVELANSDGETARRPFMPFPAHD
jgi:hypothetical protein